jgi:microcystin degradation protein MlrC
MTGTDFSALAARAESLAQAYWDARGDFAFGAWTGANEACLDRAAASAERPFVIADSGDNPTGGGVGDRPDLLRALLARELSGAVVAGIADPAATARAYEAGLGGRFAGPVGAALDPAGGPAAQVDGLVVHLAKADDPAERQAVIRAGGVSLVLTARRRPFHHIVDFTRLGLDPAAAKILVVKSGYLSPALQALAAGEAMALSPGVVDQAVERLPRLRKAHAAYPWDRDFAWRPTARPSARHRR